MIPDPLDPASSLVGGLAAQAWQAAMLGLWNAGLWLLGLVLRLEDALLTPDLSGEGPAAGAYSLTLWMAAALGTLMLLAQLLLTLLRRDARSLGEALVGCGKFVVVWAGWVGWATAVVGVCGALTRAILRSLLHVRSWSGWHPAVPTSPAQAVGRGVNEAVDTTVATVLGLLGLVLWLAALGHVFVMLGRAVTLLVLAATTPIAAAGLVGELGRGWFWRSVRWFHAAALTPLLMALLLGVGVQTSAGVTAGLAAGPTKAVATALPGVLLILASCFAPAALFRMLSFVEPNTPSGSSLRHLLGTVLQTGLLVGAPGRWPSLASSSAGDSMDTAPKTGPVTSHQAGSDDASPERHDQAESGLRVSNSPTEGPSESGAPLPAMGAAPPSPEAAVGRSGPEQTGTTSVTGQPQVSGQGASGLPAGTSAGGGGAASAVAGEAAVLPVVPL